MTKRFIAKPIIMSQYVANPKGEPERRFFREADIDRERKELAEEIERHAEEKNKQCDCYPDDPDEDNCEYCREAKELRTLAKQIKEAKG